MLRNGSLASVGVLVMLVGGCPKRQAPRSVVVYVPARVPAHAAAAPPPASEPQVLVIEEPAPPSEPEEAPPPETAETEKKSTTGNRRGGSHPARPAVAPAGPDETMPPEALEPAPAELPALEPRESSAQATELHDRYLKLEQDISDRLTRLKGAQLSSNERKTLDDARTFFEQANRAMASGDLPRALNLARKASLLLAALE